MNWSSIYHSIVWKQKYQKSMHASHFVICHPTKAQAVNKIDWQSKYWSKILKTPDFRMKEFICKPLDITFY